MRWSCLHRTGLDRLSSQLWKTAYQEFLCSLCSHLDVCCIDVLVNLTGQSVL